MSLYFIVLLGTILGPFALSFDKKVHFYTFWKILFPSILLVGTIFVLWDEYFTRYEIWGFTPKYLSGIFLGNLPIEEVLFFVLVPYACLFIYEVLIAYFPNFHPLKASKIFGFTVTFSGLLFGTFYLENWYTASACILSAMLTIGVLFVYRFSWYTRFFMMYIIAVIPFLIVNGVLTGIATPEPIVWYNSEHIMGFRLFTIPVEDLYYNYSMLIMIVWIYEELKKKYSYYLEKKR